MHLVEALERVSLLQRALVSIHPAFAQVPLHGFGGLADAFFEAVAKGRVVPVFRADHGWEEWSEWAAEDLETTRQSMVLCRRIASVQEASDLEDAERWYRRALFLCGTLSSLDTTRASAYRFVHRAHGERGVEFLEAGAHDRALLHLRLCQARSGATDREVGDQLLAVLSGQQAHLRGVGVELGRDHIRLLGQVARLFDDHGGIVEHVLRVVCSRFAVQYKAGEPVAWMGDLLRRMAERLDPTHTIHGEVLAELWIVLAATTSDPLEARRYLAWAATARPDHPTLTRLCAEAAAASAAFQLGAGDPAAARALWREAAPVLNDHPHYQKLKTSVEAL